MAQAAVRPLPAPALLPARSAASLPYSRPKQPAAKKSPWAIATGPSQLPQSPSMAISLLRLQWNPHHQQPPCLLPDSSSPENNLRTVANFLEQRRAEKSEPFRFSSSVPSTPARGNSPANDIFNIDASQEPERQLSVVWGRLGAPFKKPLRLPRVWHVLSSFVSAPRVPRLTLEELRRRVAEAPPDGNACHPPPVPRSTAPGPSPNRVAASQNFPFPSTPAPSPAANSSLTPNTLLKKTMPAHPSPLRQAWGGSPASSISSTNSSPAQGTPTKAATLLTALIRDADAEAPKRNADVRNPYQSASPVSIRVTNTHTPEAATRKRTRATGRLAAAKETEKKEKEAKEKEEQEKKEKKAKEVVPPQAIIEATLPKGSKRSRPPANFNPSASLNSLAPPSLPSPRRSPRLEPQHIDVEDEVEEKDSEERDAGAPATKRARLPNGVNGSSRNLPLAPTPAPAATQPFTFPASTPAPSVFGNNTGSSNGFVPSSATGNSVSTSNATPSGGFEFRLGPKPLATAPKEPSKLRYSFQPPPTPPPVADKPAEKKTLFPHGPAASAVPSKNVFQPFAAATSSASASTVSRTQDPKGTARALAFSALPSYVFSPTSDAHTKARDARARLDRAPSASVKGKEKEKAPVQGFNWAAAGAAPPKPRERGGRVTEKCAVCEAPRPDAPKTAPAVKGFDWGAAGAKPKAAGAAGAWTCGTCMLSNGPEVKDKCSVCDAPR
ncbi:hypothetical protein B0H14DRAFT_2707611 [Mycena olivaceomarginata]|nr:hypothetical protein B0H14DRAFT_2707611 [Mycena olivaceomarginata]